MAARVGAPAASGKPAPPSPRPAPRRLLADGHGLPEDKRPARSRPYVLHENANLVCLPLLCVLCFAGLAGVADCWLITVAFTAYIIGDLLWIFIWPESLPRFPLVIKVHHVITLALLSHPLRFPSDAHFTCMDGLVELSTFFMVARRQCSGLLSDVLNALYWFTTIALRFGLQPWLLYRFSVLAAGYAPRDRFIVMASQSCLCVFNVGLVSVAVNQKFEQGRKRRLSGGGKKAD